MKGYAVNDAKQPADVFKYEKRRNPLFSSNWYNSNFISLFARAFWLIFVLITGPNGWYVSPIILFYFILFFTKRMTSIDRFRLGKLPAFYPNWMFRTTLYSWISQRLVLSLWGNWVRNFNWLAQGDHKNPQFLRICPNGRVHFPSSFVVLTRFRFLLSLIVLKSILILIKASAKPR